MIEWSDQQANALIAIKRWLAVRDAPVFRLFGYAGTGKTTLAKTIGTIAGAGVQYAAFTGKAAMVMKQNGCYNARTIHSLIYEPYEKRKERLQELEAELASAKRSGSTTRAIELSIQKERRSLLQPGFSLRSNHDELRKRTNLFIVDEVSMVNKPMGQDMLSLDIPILVLGDPAQLPPIEGAGYFTDAEPDIMLTEIHRQAVGDPIIDLATAIRSGQEPYGVIKVADVSIEDWLAADQILVGLNRSRHYINGCVRNWLGHTSSLPMPGEKVICLRNDYEVGLLNGSMWNITFTKNIGESDIFLMKAKSPDDGRVIECRVHKKVFLQQEFVDMTDRYRAAEFDFAYAVTTHKAQGSQWDNVIYVDEWPNTATLARHRYTGVTRAIKSIKVVQWS